ncbi:Ribose operon repressor [Acidisarcina polymorpha]|uniref:Ribose operon repressor n=1 Tax=Acidisarcina polymorpha TaxID=2211140 RepID=A0A2Z5FXD0_9BACT|nr:LacI family DNA-binding transcriptional regulator [Acidisarcina polymorpha]AXC11380.1 Ribose operon repressor [Acidisarcina polymorpha]
MSPLKAKSNHVTIVDVATTSGFSPSTVSIVLNEAPLSRYVAAKTKERIRKAAKDLGYRPDAFARSLRNRRSHTVGVLIFDISDPFCTLILQGIERCLDSTAYLPIIMDAHNEKKQFEGYLEMLMERRVEGLIVVANWLFEEGGLLLNLRRNNLPTVVVGRDLSTDLISSVVVDNVAGGYTAMEHLYSLGHRKIAVIRGPEKLGDSNLRWQGIQQFAAEHNYQLDPRRVRLLPEALDPTSGFEGGVAATEDLLRSAADFTALLAFDDLTALGAIRALILSGRSVPGDCSVIGFDDVPPAAFCTPGLTTIRQPMEEMGRIATGWVLRAVQGPDTEDAILPPMQILSPQLLIRESTSRV